MGVSHHPTSSVRFRRRRNTRRAGYQGTDHGTAGPVLVAGAPLRGVFIGAQPNLTDLDAGDLEPTTNFRDV